MELQEERQATFSKDGGSPRKFRESTSEGADFKNEYKFEKQKCSLI